MAKQYKIKRYKKGPESFRPRSHTFAIVFFTLVAVALVFVGIRIYQPVYDWIMSIGVGESGASEPEPPPPEPESSSQPEESEPEPEPPPAQQESLRAVYLPDSVFTDPAKLDSFLSAMPGDVSAVMIDGKDARGNILYASENEQAIQWGAVREGAPDLSALAASLKERDVSLIVRMIAFNDAIAARGDRAGNSIHYQNTETIWLDNSLDKGGKPWLNPYSEQVRGYLTDLAVEAAKKGAAMVVFESVNFPNDLTSSGTFGDTGGLSRADILSKFVSETTLAMQEENARLAVYIPYGWIEDPDSIPVTRYGGPALDIVSTSLVLGVLPAQLGGTNDELAANVAAAVSAVKSRINAGVDLIPMIEGGGLSSEQSEAQMKAIGDSGIEEYILYSADGSYQK